MKAGQLARVGRVWYVIEYVDPDDPEWAYLVGDDGNHRLGWVSTGRIEQVEDL